MTYPYGLSYPPFENSTGSSKPPSRSKFSIHLLELIRKIKAIPHQRELNRFHRSIRGIHGGFWVGSIPSGDIYIAVWTRGSNEVIFYHYFDRVNRDYRVVRFNACHWETHWPQCIFIIGRFWIRRDVYSDSSGEVVTYDRYNILAGRRLIEQFPQIAAHGMYETENGIIAK